MNMQISICRRRRRHHLSPLTDGRKQQIQQYFQELFTFYKQMIKGVFFL